MGLFDSYQAGPNTKNFDPLAPWSGSDSETGGVGSFFTQASDPFDLFGSQGKNRADALAKQQEAERRRWKQQQYDLLGQRQGPSMTPEKEARIRALESEGATPLEQDPHFQTQMRQATTGGAQALAGIQNQQVARGAAGGFANQGSIGDVYDRMGTQLANIGQQQTNFKENAANQAAQIRQSYADAQIAYNNSLVDARTAIESGDHIAVSQAMNNMAAAKAAADQALGKNLLSAGEVVAGAYTGNPSGVSNGVKSMGNNQQQVNYNQNDGQGPTMNAYNSSNQQASPYASNNYFSDSLGGNTNEYKPWTQMRRNY